MITKEQAISLFGSVKQLQAALKLKTHSAISMWPAGQPIPEVHELRIRYELKPRAFTSTGQLRSRKQPKRARQQVKRRRAG